MAGTGLSDSGASDSRVIFRVQPPFFTKSAMVHLHPPESLLGHASFESNDGAKGSNDLCMFDSQELSSGSSANRASSSNVGVE